MITKSAGQQTMQCDDCGDDLGHSFADEDFLMLIGEARIAGWSIKKDDGVWVHHCPGCKTDEPVDRLAQARRLFKM